MEVFMYRHGFPSHLKCITSYKNAAENVALRKIELNVNITFVESECKKSDHISAINLLRFCKKVRRELIVSW